MIAHWFHVTVLVTLIGGGIIGGIIAAYDFWMLSKGPGATISYVIWTYSKRYPMIPALFGLVLGMLMGHLFWQYVQNVECPPLLAA